LPASVTTVTTANWALSSDRLVPVPAPPAGDEMSPVTMLQDQALLYGDKYGTVEDDQPPPQLFDPDSGTWTVLPQPPFDHKLDRVQVAPLDDAFLLLGEACDDLEPIESTESEVVICRPGQVEAARYDLLTRTWHTIAVPGAFDGGNRNPGSLFVLASRPAVGQALIQWKDTTWRYEADGDRWTRVSPLAPELDATVCGTDAGFVAIQTYVGSGSMTTDLVARTLEEDGAWKESPASGVPREPFAPQTTGVCTPGTVLLLGRQPFGPAPTMSYALSFNAETASWSAGPRPPALAGTLVSEAVDDGAVVFVRNDGTKPTTWHYTAADQRWEPHALPLSIGRASVRRDGVFVGDADIYGRRNVTTRTAIRLY
jgi:hypothetical protein